MRLSSMLQRMLLICGVLCTSCSSIVVRAQTDKEASSTDTIATEGEHNDLLFPIQTVPEECRDQTSQHRYTSLACWFYFLRVEIPTQSFRSHLLKITIKDLACSNFTLQGLDSYYHPDTANTSASLALGLANLSATCWGSYHTTGGLSGHMQAVIATGDHNNNNDQHQYLNKDEKDPTARDPVRLLWTLNSSYQNPLNLLQPSQLETSACLADLEVPSLKFTGSMSAQVIDWFRHSIQKYVQNEVSQQFCPAFSDLLDPLINDYLETMTDYLNQHLRDKEHISSNNNHHHHHHQTPRSRLEFDPHVQSRELQKNENTGDEDASPPVLWSTEAPTLTHSLQWMNGFIETHLQEGFLPRWFPSLYNMSTHTCGFFFHGINGVIRALVDLQKDDDNDDDNNNNGAFDLPLPHRLRNISFVWPGYGAIGLNVREIALTGLDQWQALQLFQPSVNETFHTRFFTRDPLEVRIRAQLNVSAIPGGIFSGDHELKEDFTFTLTFANLDWNTTLALWVDKSLWETNVTTGVLMDVIKGIWPGETGEIPQDSLVCLLQSIQDFYSPTLVIETLLKSMKIVPTTRSSQLPSLLSTELEQALDELVNHAIQMLLEGYPSYVSASIAGLVDGPVRNMLDGFLRRVTNSSEHKDDSDNSTELHSCPIPNQSGEPHLLNFSKVLPIQRLQKLMAHQKTIHRMNKYIQCTADYVAHAVKGDAWDAPDILGWESDTTLETSSEDSYNKYRLKITDLSLSNIGQIESLTLLEPGADGLSLSNALVYGGTATDRDDFPHVVLQLALELPNITAVANITLFWNELALEGSSLLHFNVNQLKSYGLAQVFQHGHCLLTPVVDFEASMNSPNLGLFEAIINTTVHLDSMGGDDAERNLAYSFSTANYPAVRELATSILNWALSSVRDFTNLGSMYSLSKASHMCDGHGSGYRENDENGGDNADETGGISQEVWSMLFILATMIVLAQPVVFMLKESSDMNSPDRTVQVSAGGGANLDFSAHLTQPLLDPGMGESFENEVSANKSESDTKEPALVDCPHLPILVRICLPMLILMTLFILLSSNLSTGASVELTAFMGRKSVTMPSLFEFSLFETAREMWKAQIYPLFFLVVVFSGVWPYAKLAIMLFCFISTRIHDGRRGQLLLALDSLGKFSLVDTYVLVLMMVAFRYHLQFFDEDVIGIDVFVVPKFGFYGFLLATTLSLVAGHAAVYYHRVAELALPSRTTSEPQCVPRALIFHPFQVHDKSRQLSWMAQALLLTMFATAAVLLGIGFTKKSFVFEFGGLAGIALGNEKRRTAYSLLSLGTSIPEAGHATLGTFVLMVAYFFYAVVAPFACLFFLLILLVLPLSVQRQAVVLTLAEIANAWGAVEVFCLSIIASVLEISTFSSFIVGDKCDIVNDVVKEYWPSDADLRDANCYNVRSSVEWSAGILIAGALLNSFVVSVTLHLVHTAITDRIRQEGWISLGCETPFDSLSQSHQESRTFVERVAGMFGNLDWLLLCSEENTAPDENEDEANVSQASPWERGDQFLREWENDAERDETWKNWKDQEITGNSPDGATSEAVDENESSGLS